MRAAAPNGGIWQLGALVYGLPMTFAAISHGPILIVGTVVVALIAWFHGKELHDFERAIEEERSEVDAKDKARAAWWSEWSELVDAWDDGDLDPEDWEEQRDDMIARLPR